MEQSNTKQSKPATATNVVNAWINEQNKGKKFGRITLGSLKKDHYMRIIAWAVKLGQGIGYREGLQKAKEIYDKAAQDQTVDPETKYEAVEHVEQIEASEK